MKEMIKENLYDFWKCVTISLKIYMAPVVISLLFFLHRGFFGEGFQFIYFLETLFRWSIWTASIGLLLCGGAFIKPDLMGPLDHENQWRIYFYRFGLVKVILCICLMFYVYAISLDYILWFMR